MTHSTTTPGSKVGRARRTLGQLWQAPVFLLGLLAFVGVAASTPWRLTPQEREFEHFVHALRHGLENKESGDALVAHAENVNLRLPRFPTRSAEAEFLVGSAYYRQAMQKPAGQAKDIWPRAAEHLDRAFALGGAPADRAVLQYRLGYCLYQQNVKPSRALELMAAGVEKGAEDPLTAYQLLVKAYLNRTPPDLDQARSAVRRILDLTPERDVEAMAAARLQHGELLMRKEMRADAIKEFERIGPKASRKLRVKARLLQARCQEEERRWSKAIPIWQELNADADQVAGGKARIAYALGWCYYQMEPRNTPGAIQAWSDALKFGGSEGQAAGLRLGNLRLTVDAAQALTDWKTALLNINQPNDYKNAYLAIEEVREWFDQALDYFQEAQDPEKTQIVAELYRKIMPGGVAEERLALAAEARAKQLAGKLKIGSDNVTAADVQAQYHRAGEAWEQTALARTQAERPESLWRGVQCYLRAKEVVRAQQILVQYVKMEIKETQLAEALFTLGDLYRQDGQMSVAHERYVACIECGKTPFAYRSRYWLAVEEEIDRNNPEKARSILQDNLLDQSAEVERSWYEKSAFKMASLMMKIAQTAEGTGIELARKRRENPDKVSQAEVEAMVRRAGAGYGEALVHLKDCLHNFPDNPSTVLTREQLGKCYRKLAEKERTAEKELQREITADLPPERLRILEDRIGQHRNQRIDTLKEAVKVYLSLADELERARAGGKQLSNLELVLLRRARFGLGECYLDNHNFDEAKVIFVDLQRKHRGSLESLVASVKICQLVDVIREPPSKSLEMRETAKESLRNVLEDLKMISPEDDMFRLPGVTSHAVWRGWAQDTLRILSAPPAKENRPFP